MIVGEIWDWLDRFAPFASQPDFDNSGLVAGDPAAEVRRVLFALDATLPVVREAADMGAELIVTHHPLLFQAVRRVRYDRPEGAALAALLGARIHLISAHTNLDQAEGGTGTELAALLGLGAVTVPAASAYIRLGRLPAPKAAGAFLADIDHALGTHARLYGDPAAVLERVAVGPGAIGEAYEAARLAGAQAFVVGEIKHHELIAAQGMGLAVFEAGHYATEQPGLAALYRRFVRDAQAERWPVEARLSALTPYDVTVGNQLGRE
jgi:GTP cyclohydrolase I